MVQWDKTLANNGTPLAFSLALALVSVPGRSLGVGGGVDVDVGGADVVGGGVVVVGGVVVDVGGGGGGACISGGDTSAGSSLSASGNVATLDRGSG